MTRASSGSLYANAPKPGRGLPATKSQSLHTPAVNLRTADPATSTAVPRAPATQTDSKPWAAFAAP
ncbi:hypothetical protein BO99DRAFT_429574 [Aspergillus violaceofuscus CBS 115571]|uniref:Uncharacterized protein n=1 Tax=Aspergillus violaceofuscus (strain CBS 115571) TaxID=1450538 RepID=A0A2V5I299_ASPV1|nr:hypothetical protein BO99DRAFT_429574 [Aspergillus violaceofuscus CBS 115571]